MLKTILEKAIGGEANHNEWAEFIDSEIERFQNMCTESHMAEWEWEIIADQIIHLQSLKAELTKSK